MTMMLLAMFAAARRWVLRQGVRTPRNHALRRIAVALTLIYFLRPDDDVALACDLLMITDRSSERSI